MIKNELARYDDYRDSEFSWLDKIPNHWHMERVKTLTKTQSGTTPRSEIGEYYENGTNFWVRTTDLNNDRLYSSEYKITDIALKYCGLKIIPVNSVLLAMYGGMGTIGKNSILKEKVTINQSVCAVLPNDKSYNSIYFWYYIQYFRPHWEMFADSARKDPNINQEAIKRLWVITPPLFEQQAIAGYLDTKTAQIDRKIDLLTEKVTKYGQLKQSLINETVTRGLYKTVAMKDSGVEWIGEVPKHWNVNRTKGCFRYRKELNRNFKDDNILSLTYAGVINKDTSTNMGLLPTSYETYQIFYKNDLAFKLIDLANIKTSRVGIVHEKGIMSPVYIRLQPSRSIFSRFFFYLYTYYYKINLFNYLGGAGVRSSLTYNELLNIAVAIPPYEEQQAISEYLDNKTAQIDRIVEIINTQIGKLKELRKTLINDVVTGKIKVYREGETI